MGPSEPDFQGLTANITKLDGDVKGKLSKIRGELEAVKTKAQTASTSLTAKLQKMEGDSKAKIVQLESDIKNLKTTNENEKAKITSKINELNKTVTGISSAINNNNDSNNLITALDGVIANINKQLNTGSQGAPAQNMPAPAPTTQKNKTKPGKGNINQRPPFRGGYRSKKRSTRRRSSSRRSRRRS